jgi:hypothetical protein
MPAPQILKRRLSTLKKLFTATHELPELPKPSSVEGQTKRLAGASVMALEIAYVTVVVTGTIAMYAGISLL